MSEVYLFQLASQRTQWLDARQLLIASNVANANTPGYHARDVQPFSAVLAQTQISLTATKPGHITLTQSELNAPGAEDADASNETLSGNSVDLEREMINLGDVGRAANTTNAIKKIFHQMMMSALK